MKRRTKISVPLALIIALAAMPLVQAQQTNAQQAWKLLKVRGIVEPQGKQRFPLFETWRESAGATFAFPSRTEADDVLHFPNRDVNYRIRLRYYDYKLFASTVSVRELDQPGN